jgi:hypothetical protein
MNKFILAIAFIASVGMMNAQGVKFGLTAGLNTSTLTSNDSDDDFSWKLGFQIGALADIAVTETFSVIPELNFSQKGFKIEFEEDGESANLTYNLNYLTLPINLAYKVDLGLSGKILLFAGPYLGYGLSISGKAKAAGITVDLEEAGMELKFGSDEDNVKALDFGVNVGAGYQYEKVFFKLQYNLGLSNLSNYDDYTMKNGNIAVTAGYLF